MTSEPEYFADENVLGLGRLLRRSGRTDVFYPGHPGLPAVPRETPDVVWMEAVARRGLIVITRDKRIRTRPAELAVFRQVGIRAVWIGGKQDLAPSQQVRLFLDNEVRLKREIIKRGDGPWALRMTTSGLRPIALPGD